MNIFVLHDDPTIAAKYLHDSHVVKMVIESTQMLSAAMLSVGLSAPMRVSKAQMNHPCTLWTAHSLENYQWLWRHAAAIGREYWFRFGRYKRIPVQHKTYQRLLDHVPYDPPMLSRGLTKFVIDAPPEYQSLPYDAVVIYRKLYVEKKLTKINGAPNKWTRRQIPHWVPLSALK